LARPVLKPPEEIFPEQKAAQYDSSGRPFHTMFYTAYPHLYKMLFDIVDKTNELLEYGDAMNLQNVQPDPALNLAASLADSKWLTQEALEKRLLEKVSESSYERFLAAVERLLITPFSYVIKDFILQYREPIRQVQKKYDIVKPKLDEDGRHYVTIYNCMRKNARGIVTVKSPGTGKITINKKDINHFSTMQPREQILFPLIFTNTLGKVDVEASVIGGGFTGQAGAIRWGISMALRSFVDEQTRDELRIAGLLKLDHRRRERKKPGQEGARRKYTWKKR